MMDREEQTQEKNTQVVESYTVEEVAQLLHLAESTIYKYAKEGLLEEVHDPFLKYKMSRKRVFTKESVLRLKETLEQSSSEGYLNFNTFCQRLNMSPYKMRNLLAEYKITLKQGRHGLHKRYVVTPEVEHQILDILESDERYARDLFFNKKLDIALYQAFQDPQRAVYRVTRNKGWGFFMPMGFVPFEEAVSRHQLTPVYNIHQPLKHGTYSIELRFPLDDLSTIFPLIDVLYETIGIENLQMYRIKDTLRFKLKNNQWAITNTESFKVIENYIQEGELHIQDGMITTISTDKRLSVRLTNGVYQQLRKYSEQHKFDENQAVNQILKSYFANLDK